MGEHKHNPTAVAARKGELPPKNKPMSKRESDRQLYQLVHSYLYTRTPLGVIEKELQRSDYDE